MADSDKELSAIQALGKIECTHTSCPNTPVLASRCSGVYNEQLRCRFLPPRGRDLKKRKGIKCGFKLCPSGLILCVALTLLN